MKMTWRSSRGCSASTWRSVRHRHVRFGPELLECARRAQYDLIVLDHGLPDMSGLALLEILAARDGSPPVIMLTGQGDERIAAEAMGAGAYDYFPKDAITSEM